MSVRPTPPDRPTTPVRKPEMVLKLYHCLMQFNASMDGGSVSTMVDINGLEIL